MCLAIAFTPCSHLQASSFELFLRHVCARTRVSGVGMLPCVSRQRSEMGSDILTSTFLYLSFETGSAAHHFGKTWELPVSGHPELGLQALAPMSSFLYSCCGRGPNSGPPDLLSKHLSH